MCNSAPTTANLELVAYIWLTRQKVITLHLGPFKFSILLGKDQQVKLKKKFPRSE